MKKQDPTLVVFAVADTSPLPMSNELFGGEFTAINAVCAFGRTESEDGVDASPQCSK